MFKNKLFIIHAMISFGFQVNATSLQEVMHSRFLSEGISYYQQLGELYNEAKYPQINVLSRGILQGVCFQSAKVNIPLQSYLRIETINLFGPSPNFDIRSDKAYKIIVGDMSARKVEELMAHKGDRPFGAELDLNKYIVMKNESALAGAIPTNPSEVITIRSLADSIITMHGNNVTYNEAQFTRCLFKNTNLLTEVQNEK